MTSSTPSSLMPTYARIDKHFVRGDACSLFDENGKQYLDALSGIGVISLGHANKAIAKVIAEQANILLHSSNIFRNPQQEALADKLTQVSGMDNCFFANSGAEANEAAIKIARLFGKQKGLEEAQIIVMENAFHGRTLATLSASASRKVQAGFEPLVPGFVRVPLNNMAAIEEVVKKNKNVVAVFLEPVQGEGGLHIADADYLKSLARFCTEQDLLLMFDEVQTGNGRCGNYFAYQKHGLKPDVVTTAKGLGNGLPIGACLSSGKAASLMQAGNHGSTFGGNHLVCAAALEVVNTISEPGFLNAVQEKSNLLESLLSAFVNEFEIVKALRIQGLMIGIELEQDCGQLVQEALDEGIIINVTSGNVIRLLPPLVIEKQEIEHLVKVLHHLLNKLNSSK